LTLLFCCKHTPQHTAASSTMDAANTESKIPTPMRGTAMGFSCTTTPPHALRPCRQVSRRHTRRQQTLRRGWAAPGARSFQSGSAQSVEELIQQHVPLHHATIQGTCVSIEVCC
jgi:hypothetical protein